MKKKAGIRTIVRELKQALAQVDNDWEVVLIFRDKETGEITAWAPTLGKVGSQAKGAAMRTKRETPKRSRGTGNQRGTQAHGTRSVSNAER